MLSRLDIPIIQAPMLGATTLDIALAVSKAGGLGSIAAAGSSPQQILELCAAARAATDRAFAVNIFVLDKTDPDPAVVRAAIERLAPWRERYGLPPQTIPNSWAQDTAAQVAAIVEAAPPAASFTFGCLSREQCDALKARGVYVVGTATTVAEAKAWEAVGAHAVCAQGVEAGGHRGAFLADMDASAIGTMALARTIREAVDLPLIVAGGVTDGAQIAAAMMLGADAVQIGTAYLLCEEATVNAPWRAALEQAPDDGTRLTRAISGRWARGLDNEFMRALRPVENDVAPYPIQNALTQDLRAAAVKAGSTDVASLWAGQSVKLARKGRAGELTVALWREAQAVMRARVTRYGGDPQQRRTARRASNYHGRMAQPYQAGGDDE